MNNIPPTMANREGLGHHGGRIRQQDPSRGAAPQDRRHN
jgi:hypothetical protein